MKIPFLLLGLLCAACAPINQYMAGQNAAIIAGTKGANDNAIVGIEAAICEVPIGAVIRNAEFVPIATAACMPGGVGSSAGGMLQQMGAQTAPVIPAYQQTINNMSAQTPVAPVVVKPTPIVKHIVKATPKPVAYPAPVATPTPAPVVAPAPAPFGALPNGGLQ